MELSVHGKQIDVGDALRTHVSDRIEDINEKYFNHGTYATVTFSKEGHGHKQIRSMIQIEMGKGIMVVADSTDHDPYVSFEAAAEKVQKQLRRYKRKLRDHHERLEQTPEAEIKKARNYVLADDPDADVEDDDKDAVGEDTVPQGDDPVIIAETDSQIETLSVSEAVMRMDLANINGLMFRNTKNDRLNVVYRRRDGNIGWIDPEES